jgi:hypothetical protein
VVEPFAGQMDALGEEGSGWLGRPLRRGRRGWNASDLGKHPGWEVFCEAGDQYRQQFLRTLSLTEEVSVRQFDYMRGKVAAIAWMIGIVENALDTLEKAEQTARKVGLEE